jgi:hypothetical protein
MSEFSTIPWLTLVGIADRGLPYKERVILRTALEVDLGRFALVCGPSTPEGGIVPSKEHFFKFDNGVVRQDSWVLVYSSPGKSVISYVPQSNEPVLVLHWGAPTTLFHNATWTVGLIEVSGLAVAAL